MELTFERTDNMGSKTVVIPTIPQSVMRQYVPQYSQQQVLGRATPIQQYTGAQGTTLQFNVSLHEDVHANLMQGYTLEDLVNDIKSLSTPTLDKNGVLGEYPRVLMTLGDLVNFVKVETHVEWVKPMRHGKYIMADISFTANVLQELEPISFEDVFETVGATIVGDVIYKDVIGYVYTKEQKEYESNYIDPRYGVSIPNLIVNPTVLLNNETTTSVWDTTMERLKTLFGLYGTQMETRGKEKSYETLDKSWKQFLNEYRDITNPNIDYTKMQEMVKQMMTQHDKYMDYYYNNVNKEMLPSEREAIKKQFNQFLKTLEEAAGGIMGYGYSK